MNSKYRKYDRNVPKYLVNRPAHFVKHCLLKITIGKNADMSGIVMKSNGEFIVHSFKDNREHYNVKFGTDDEMPSCSCSDWNHSMHLCKHFFAIFNKFPDTWSWNAISSLYRNSPFLTMDEEMIKEDGEMANKDGEIATGDTKMTTENAEMTMEDAGMTTENAEMTMEEAGTAKENEEMEKQSENLEPTKSRNKDIDYGPMVRDVIGQLRNISYELKNEDSKELYESLSSILKQTEQKRKREDLIPLLMKPKSIPTKKSYQYSKLSLNRKRQTNNRVGEKSEMMKKAKLIKVEPENNLKKKFKHDIVEESIVGSSGMGEAKFDTKEIIFIDEDEGDEDLVLTNYPSTNRSELSHRTLRILSNNLMLTDNVIFPFLKMIQRQYPLVEGLQDTVLGQTLAYDVMQNLPFLQVTIHKFYNNFTFV